MDAFFSEYLTTLKKLHCDFIATFDDLPDEALDWVPGEDMNSLVVLVVHTTGSARFWIGEVGAGDPAYRDRPAEFEAKGLTKDELKARFSTLEAYLSDKFEQLTLADLGVARPDPRKEAGGTVTAAEGILHALEHTGLHLGHAQITRQLWQHP